MAWRGAAVRCLRWQFLDDAECAAIEVYQNLADCVKKKRRHLFYLILSLHYP